MSYLSQILAERASDKRHDDELWRFDYEHYPYLKNLTPAELDTRLAGLERNHVYLLGPDRDAVPERVVYLSSWWWLKKRLQTIVEYQSRGLVPPPLAPEPPPPSAPPFAPQHPNSCSFVVRYGERWWLEAMLHEGNVRIAPASSYENEALAGAQQDNELRKPHYSLGDKVRITTADGRVMPIIGDVEHVRPAVANYYVLCAANEFDERLFPLFANKTGEPAEACVVVWDVDSFAERLELAARPRLSDCYFHHNPVQYFDPRRLEPKQRINAGMSKDFSFAHQREYRFLWMPIRGGEAQSHLELELGPLTDIAGLFLPDGTCVAGRASA